MPTTPATNERVSKSPAPLRPLLNEKQAAEFLNVSPRTLQAWRVKGGGPAFLKLGAAVRYRPEALADWVEEQNRANTSDTGPAAA